MQKTYYNTARERKCIMANITIRINDDLKVQLQELMNELGMDMTTFFTIAAKQAVREQSLPFLPKINSLYVQKAYDLALRNTKYINDKPVVSKDDEWVDEKEWDELFLQLKNERGNSNV